MSAVYYEAFRREQKARAVRLLTHYLRLAGVVSDRDNEVEIAEIVDAIVNAARGPE